MFSASRLLFFAKTAVKETATKKRPTLAAAAAKAKTPRKTRDPSLPPPSAAFTLPDLIEHIPPPPPDAPQSEWQHKGGWGLKFYRKQWAKYPEPSYWTVTRYKPSTHGHKRKVWGVLTWRGQRTAAHTRGGGYRGRRGRSDVMMTTSQSVNPLTPRELTTDAIQLIAPFPPPLPRPRTA